MIATLLGRDSESQSPPQAAAQSAGGRASNRAKTSHTLGSSSVPSTGSAQGSHGKSGLMGEPGASHGNDSDFGFLVWSGDLMTEKGPGTSTFFLGSSGSGLMMR